MSKHLSLVGGKDGPTDGAQTPPPESPHAARIREIAEEAIKAGALTFMALWEDPAENLCPRAIPNTYAMQLGYMTRFAAYMGGDDPSDEDLD